MLEPLALQPALEVVLGRARLREEVSHGLELVRPMQMRRAGDCDLGVVEVGAGAHDRQRLDRLRRAAEVRDELGVAARVENLPIGHGDRVDSMPRLDGIAAPGLDDDRAHSGRD